MGGVGKEISPGRLDFHCTSHRVYFFNVNAVGLTAIGPIPHHIYHSLSGGKRMNEVSRAIAKISNRLHAGVRHHVFVDHLLNISDSLLTPRSFSAGVVRLSGHDVFHVTVELGFPVVSVSCTAPASLASFGFLACIVCTPVCNLLSLTQTELLGGEQVIGAPSHRHSSILTLGNDGSNLVQTESHLRGSRAFGQSLSKYGLDVDVLQGRGVIEHCSKGVKGNGTDVALLGAKGRLTHKSGNASLGKFERPVVGISIVIALLSQSRVHLIQLGLGFINFVSLWTRLFASLIVGYKLTRSCQSFSRLSSFSLGLSLSIGVNSFFACTELAPFGGSKVSIGSKILRGHSLNYDSCFSKDLTCFLINDSSLCY